MNDQQLTPQQALEIVIDATGKLQADRNTHSIIQTALKVLEGAIQPASDPKAVTVMDSTEVADTSAE
jgi:glyceraldehyde-3-phosphate dehydrogenase/erythrose-4-phosphate dehydrogenase